MRGPLIESSSNPLGDVRPESPKRPSFGCRVDLLKYVAVDDCGTVINPMIVEGQLQGGNRLVG
jgi:Molybdopterin-binding domain of aldehyde dehydrogenase